MDPGTEADNVFVTAPDDAQQRAARRLLDKLRAFARELDDLERATLAALLAPGIARAYGEGDGEVGNSGLVEWLPDSLPEMLARTIRERRVRDGGFGDDS